MFNLLHLRIKSIMTNKTYVYLSGGEYVCKYINGRRHKMLYMDFVRDTLKEIRKAR